MLQLPGTTPLDDAKAALRASLDKGERCPCCTQMAKTYRRTIHSGMALALIHFHKKCGTDFGYKPKILQSSKILSRDESFLRYWGLFEEAKERRADGGRAGWWRVTALGENFILGLATVPKYAVIYDSRLLRLEGSFIGIQDALGSKFDYNEVMGFRK